jgi:serine/threonine-protein kinase
VNRLCPKCGKRTLEARCPEDGTATLVFAANPDARLQPGAEINGRYRIRELIGQGGFGAVYRATSIATDQDMAIKLLAVSLESNDSDMIQRFFAEAQITASLKHPNTIRVFDFGQAESGALYIAMELLNGKPLIDHLEERAEQGPVLSEEEAIGIGVQALRSLAEAHMAKLVHRDLKPHNIFLHEVAGDDAVVKVLDFGIAKKLGSNLTGTGKAFGTPSYMSPEQAQNRPLDHRSDLYSLGCVLYQCVAGRPPFEGDNPLAVLLSHVTEPAPDLRKTARAPVSDGFAALVQRAMAKDPAERFASALDMRQALEACRGALRREMPADRPTAPPEPTSAARSEPDASLDARTVAYEVPIDASRTAAYDAPLPVAAAIAGPPTSPPPAGPAPGASLRLVPLAAAQGEAVLAEPRHARQSEPSHARQSEHDQLQSLPGEAPDASPLPPSGVGAGRWFAGATLAAVVVGGGWWTLREDETYLRPDAPASPTVAEGAVPATAPGAGTAAAAGAPTAAALAPHDVLVVSEPPGARVHVGGQDVGATPFKVRVVDKPVVVGLSLVGYRDRDIDVLPTDGAEKRVALQPQAQGTKPADTAEKPGKSDPTSGKADPTPDRADKPAEPVRKSTRPTKPAPRDDAKPAPGTDSLNERL